MSEIKKSGNSRSVNLAIALWAASVAGWFAYAYGQFSLDDAAIYQRIIGNLAHYGVYSFDLYDHVNPGTSTLYPLLLVPLAFVFPQVDLHILAVTVDSALLFGSAFLLMKFLHQQFDSVLAPMLTAVLFFILPIGDLFGMETMLLLFILSFYLYFHDNARLRMISVALAPLVRPEAMVLLAVEGLQHWRDAGFQWRRIPQALKTWWPVLVPFGVVCAFNTLYFGAPLSHSASNKLAQGTDATWSTYGHFLAETLKSLPQHKTQLAIIGLAILGGWHAYRRKIAPLGFFTLTIALWQAGLIGLKAPYYTWYPVALFFFIGVMVLVGFAQIEIWFRAFAQGRRGLFTTVVFGVVVLILAGNRFIPRQPRPPESREIVQTKAAKYIESIAGEGPYHVGALEVGHFANNLDPTRFSIFDLTGLTSRNKGFFQPGFHDELFCEKNPQYLVINYAHRPTEPLRIEETVGKEFTLYRSRKGRFHERAWPHHLTTVADSRFLRAYEFKKYIEVKGYGGGLAVFQRQQGFACSTEQMQVAEASASRESSPANSADRAFDGNFHSSWNAGDFPPQSLTVKFAEVASLSGIRFDADLSDPENELAVQVRMFDENGSLTDTMAVDMTVAVGDTVELKFENEIGVAAIEVSTLKGPGWVSWRELSFF